MKKKLLFRSMSLLSAASIAMVGVSSVTSCATQDDPTPEHIHTYVWKHNDQFHWQECEECGHTTAKKAHFDKDGDHKCDVCGYDMGHEEPEGSVFNIACWNEEFLKAFKKYISDEKNELADPCHLKGTEVKFTMVPSADNAYQNYLDEKLPLNETASETEKIDLFLGEADYIKKYTNSPYSLDIYDCGLAKSDTDDCYAYSQNICKDKNGAVKGLAFNFCPSVLIYRRSIAKDVFAVDDPNIIATKVDTWQHFQETADALSAKGYIMTDYEYLFKSFSFNIGHAWVNESKELTIPQEMLDCVDLCFNMNLKKQLSTGGIWGAEWSQALMMNGNAFCAMGPSWYIDFCMPHDEGSAAGDWAICTAPDKFNWGGTWVLPAAGNDNHDLVKETLSALVNDEVLYKICSLDHSFVNSHSVNHTCAEEHTHTSEFLYGQEDWPVFCEAACDVYGQDIDYPYGTIYDAGLNDRFISAMKDYFEGLVDLPTAIEDFKNIVRRDYPDIKVD